MKKLTMILLFILLVSVGCQTSNEENNETTVDKAITNIQNQMSKGHYLQVSESMDKLMTTDSELYDQQLLWLKTFVDNTYSRLIEDMAFDKAFTFINEIYDAYPEIVHKSAYDEVNQIPITPKFDVNGHLFISKCLLDINTNESINSQIYILVLIRKSTYIVKQLN